MRIDLFQRLPAPTAVLLLGSILELTSAHLLQVPKQTPLPTATIPHHALNVASWPLMATPAPRNPFDLFRRQDETNTICGYIGGDSALPATCSAGSHCVVDVDLNVVGCCPNGVASCTAGVFTGCVDSNSGPQTVANPYVYTCVGSDVCFKNVFDGGASQFGCGTASSLGTTVMASASGGTTTISRPTVSVSISGTRSSSRSSSSSSSSSRSSSSSSTSTSSSSTTGGLPAGATSSNRPGPPIPASSNDRVGPIIGGVIGGVSVLLAICAVLFFLIRRKRGNLRRGPGGGSETYVSGPKGPDSGFTPLHQSQDAFESGLPPTAAANVPPRGPPVVAVPVWAANMNPNGPSPFTYAGAAGSHTSYPPPGGYHYPGQFPAAYAGAGTPVIITGAPAGIAHAHAATFGGGSGKGKAPLESDEVPLTRETDEPGQGHQKGLGRIGEEEEEHPRTNTGTSSGADMSEMSGAQVSTSGSGSGNGNGGHGPNSPDSESNSPGGRPLWQQNRRQSRNQMWM